MVSTTTEGMVIETIKLQPENIIIETNINIIQVKTSLIFRLSRLLIGRDVHLFTNYPIYDHDAKNSFDRNIFQELEWRSNAQTCCEFDPDRWVSIDIKVSGVYNYMYKWASYKDEPIKMRGTFIVEPNLTIPLNSLSMHTYIVKCLGALEQWESKLSLTKYCAYNSVHFTPIQQRGSSQSAFSIYDHLSLDDSVIPKCEESNELSSPDSLDLFSIQNKYCKNFSYANDKRMSKFGHYLKNLFSSKQMISIIDIVWNHCSFDCKWLKDHPEAGYNLYNSPHLVLAYILDRELYIVAREIGNGVYAESHALTSKVPNSSNDAAVYKERLLSILEDNVIKRAKLDQFYVINVDEEIHSIQQLFANNNAVASNLTQTTTDTQIELKIVLNYRRYGATIDRQLALQLFYGHLSNTSSSGSIEQADTNLRNALVKLNAASKISLKDKLTRAINNVINGFNWFYIDDNGPKKRFINQSSLIVDSYFFNLKSNFWLTDEQLESGVHNEFILTHNGYVMNYNTLIDPASVESEVYLNRELVVWGDSCKLRYGETPNDSPWLWEYMRHYTIIMAKIFDGFRIDNCHNTPLHVAELFLDEARKVNPNLLVVAELFTSEEQETLYTNTMGLNLLIREALNSYTPHDLGGQVHQFGGRSYGSFFPRENQPLRSTRPPALFYDMTHDNPSIIEKRSVFDCLPTAALLAMNNCPYGSCRGCDEFVPHRIDIVQEKRQYKSYNDNELETVGMVPIKKILNSLHDDLSMRGYTDIYVHDITSTIVSVTRINPHTLESVVLIVHSAFEYPEACFIPTTKNEHKLYSVDTIHFEGNLDNILVEGNIQQEHSANYIKDNAYINGFTEFTCSYQVNISPSLSKFLKITTPVADKFNVKLHNFPPGAIIVFHITLTQKQIKACNLLRGLASFHPMSISSTQWHQQGLNIRNTLHSMLNNLDLLDINFLLYHCEPEEQEVGGGVYDVPNCGKFVYAGLQGVCSVLDQINYENNLSHSLCNNIREGNWLVKYTVERLKAKKNLTSIADLLKSAFLHFNSVISGLRPSYVDLVLTSIKNISISCALRKFNAFISENNSIVKELALCSIQLVSDCKSAHLPKHNRANTKLPMANGSLAAGLPHFSTGRMRCWGRDTFISLHGLLIIPGRYEIAKQHILSFAATIRHGLIPNLLAKGEFSRYNCRDAPWWWLQSIKDYCLSIGNNTLLKERITRIFLNDNADAFSSAKEETIESIIQEILQRHCSGVIFEERGKGYNLDSDMSDKGFTVKVGVDLETGFVFGGSENNCGTWMDKMGSSDKAGNKGKPATPRDGSAIELVALCKSVISWLDLVHSQNEYSYSGVNLSDGKLFTYKNWSGKILKNFEGKFWIPSNLAEAQNKMGENHKSIHRTGIYKDCHGATHNWTDFQLRPNFPIAMVVAPELFTPTNALIALNAAQNILLGPLGMKTLDPKDWNYRGNYENFNASDNYNIAHGFNYHQGPEWVWVVGYFLQAKYLFTQKLSNVESKHEIRFIFDVIGRLAEHMAESEWKGIPELTNENGKPCEGSCHVQAWSVSGILGFLKLFSSALMEK